MLCCTCAVIAGRVLCGEDELIGEAQSTDGRFVASAYMGECYMSATEIFVRVTDTHSRPFPWPFADRAPVFWSYIHPPGRWARVVMTWLDDRDLLIDYSQFAVYGLCESASRSLTEWRDIRIKHRGNCHFPEEVPLDESSVQRVHEGNGRSH